MHSPMKTAPEVMAFLVDPDVLAAASDNSKTYGAPNDCWSVHAAHAQMKVGGSTYCYEVVAYQRADGRMPRGCPNRDSPDYDRNAR